MVLNFRAYYLEDHSSLAGFASGDEPTDDAYRFRRPLAALWNCSTWSAIFWMVVDLCGR